MTQATADVEERGSAKLPADLSTRWDRTLGLWAFGLVKLPLLFYLRPKVLRMTEDEAVLRLALSRRSRNHYGTMYFGALATVADAIPGMFAVILAQKQRRKVSFFMKEARATFAAKANADVLFVCRDGAAVSSAIRRSAETGHATAITLQVDALLTTTSECAASFWFTMSVKAK